MASPVTHIVLTDKVFNKYFPGHDRKKFFIGTSFPDIRYYDNMDREETHPDGKTLAAIIKEDSFSAGLHFHALLDKKWGAFYYQQRSQPAFISSWHVFGTALKFFQDELFYERFGGWASVSSFFDDILEEEKSFDPDLSEEDIRGWHGRLQKYFAQKPNEETRRFSLVDNEATGDFLKQVNVFIEQMRANKEITESLNDFYDKFESLF
ncbi:MAG TPA: hypothetical protein P5089_00795 [Candidatus Portnoybacteria bacterium]|nr:hypothetical protein [Candidatus Portnoybacteria bacterium]